VTSQRDARPTSPGLQAALATIDEIDQAAAAAARNRLDQLTKPLGSLGRLEALAVQLAGITGDSAWRPGKRTIVVFAADHGVAARAVSAYPQAVTAQMVANFLAGGAAINVLARQAGANVFVVDVGVASAVLVPPRLPDGVRFLSRPIRAGTSDMTTSPAMTRAETEAAIGLGLEIAANEAAAGTSVLGTGEMGIANTTSASAITAAMTGRPPAEVTGRGTGIDDAGHARKIAAIERALRIHRSVPDDALGVLAAVGGFEIAALTGLILGAAAAHIPVLLDGFIAGAAALVAEGLAPAIGPRLIASHLSTEAGHRVVLEHLGLRPLLDLELRLGEGTGTALAMRLMDAACDLRDGMATFASARVSGPT
jgi:nicotinate-nucleotide--dimethylbenzimidazole phosphoribosyltransferase